MENPRAEYDLVENQAMSIRDLTPGRILYCLAGMIWVTQQGEARDRVLGPGGSYRIERSGRLVVAALRRSHFLVAAREEIESLEALKARRAEDESPREEVA